MIEEIILEYLSDALPVPCYMEMPEDITGEFIVIEKTGSSRRNMINRSTFAFQAYAPTLYAAADLNESVKAAVDDMLELNEIIKVELNSDYNYTDTVMKRYRYQAVYVISHY